MHQSPGDRENQQAWEDLLENLKERGVKTIDLWITDGGKAMINAIENKFSPSKRQPAFRPTPEFLVPIAQPLECDDEGIVEPRQKKWRCHYANLENRVLINYVKKCEKKNI